MSLQVWLPLTGDLHNQGLNKVQFTNNGATVNASGKIGSCYSFNGSSNYLKTTYNFYNSKYSICAWIYSTSSSATQTICCNRTAVGSGFSTFLIGGKLRIDPGGNNLQWTTNYTYPTNTWFHLAITYDGSKVSYYINGIYKESKAQAISNSYWTSTTSIGASQANNSNYGNYLNGRLNDIRIYNHCLSAKEVEEISKALVVHYKLNQSVLTKYDKTIYTEPDGTHWLRLVHHNNPGSGLFASTDTFETGVYKDANKWYDVAPVNLLSSFEFMVKQKTTSGATETKYRWIQSINPLKAVYDDVAPAAVTRITTSGYTDGTFGGLWKRNVNTRLCIANANSGNWYGALGSWTAYNKGIPGYPNTTVTTGYIDLYVRIDELFTTIYDSSGYSHNGSLINSIDINSISSKFNNVISFDGTDDGILIENLPLKEIINNNVTYSFWIKPNGENGARSVYFGSYNSTSWSIEKTTGNIIRSWWNGSPDTSCTGASITDGVWQHVCIVKNGSTDLKVYINGIQKYSNTSLSLSALNLPTTYRIGRDTRSGDGTPYCGDMTDFRIYATALTAAQIQDLYKTSMIVNGTSVTARSLE